MKNTSTTFDNKGMTLIEVLVSLVILSIIVVSILPFFIQSSRTTDLSENIVNATLLAETEMESIINMNTTLPSESLEDFSNRILARGYERDPSCNGCYGMYKDRQYISIQLSDMSGNLGKVILRIYDDNKNRVASQMEMILTWEK